jgi:serine/threonine protein kinase
MILLGITGVSLTMCRDTFELQQRLHQADIIIISNLYRDQVDNDCDLDAVVIPVIDEDMPYDSDSSFLRLPFKREEVHQLMVEASEYVAKAKDERKLREEQEIVLRARHDAPWTKGALLGRGTFGVCYVATNEINDAKMAVKQFTVPQRGEQAEKFMRDLVNEIRILKALDHPNIVHYFYCERSDTGVNLFMELCDGSLQDIIKARTSPDPMKRDLYRRGLPTIMQQTLSAVAYLHEMNITHRDLKPQNILVKGDRIKLTDFGTAHQLANKDETLREVQGTLRFMAPEVFKGESYNQSCDTWSIGCLMCVLLEVKVPWMQNKSEHLLVDLQQKDINLDNATHISSEARDLMNLCLQVPKHLRPPVKTLLMHPFVQNLDPTFRISQLTGVKTNVDQSGGTGRVAASRRRDGGLAAAKSIARTADASECRGRLHLRREINRCRCHRPSTTRRTAPSRRISTSNPRMIIKPPRYTASGIRPLCIGQRARTDPLRLTMNTPPDARVASSRSATDASPSTSFIFPSFFFVGYADGWPGWSLRIEQYSPAGTLLARRVLNRHAIVARVLPQHTHWTKNNRHRSHYIRVPLPVHQEHVLSLSSHNPQLSSYQATTSPFQCLLALQPCTDATRMSKERPGWPLTSHVYERQSPHFTYTHTRAPSARSFP